MTTNNLSKYKITARNTSGTTKDNWLAKPQTAPPSFLNIYPDVISAEICKEIITRFNQDSRVKPSNTQGNDTPLDRTGTMLGIGILPEWEEIADTVQQAIEERIHHYAETLLYLADIPIGGQTQFAFQMSEVQPQAGSLVLFPPYWTHLHRGVTPEQGTKYNITNFVILNS